jgi:L,D-peptidoglycan transpeptidase YkuD (ErfK/YbiS/YcfS/YnhG family)
VYPVSTAKNGVGSKTGSQRTPLGLHRVHSKFGAGEPLGMVFDARRATGKLAAIHTTPVDLPEDVITTRILWLEGLEAGKNRGKGVDSHTRFIYIHGTNEEGLIGQPASHGCVRMRNRDVVELFELVAPGTLVEIVE